MGGSWAWKKYNGIIKDKTQIKAPQKKKLWLLKQKVGRGGGGGCQKTKIQRWDFLVNILQKWDNPY